MNDIRNRVIELDINDVLPNRFQPRVKFNEEAIIELSESIREHGIIQPIIVRPIGDKYEIIAGERRYKASILAGKETIPAIITDLNDKDSAEIALIENVQRKNLTPIEEAVSYKKILDMGYLTQEQLALKLGRSQSSIANKMRLLHLSDDVQEALIEEKISERHARSLLKLNTAEKQNEMLERIISERLTVRKTDEEIEKMNQGISQVEEPKSFINSLAFDNNNPGFVDVNKIENQAQELTESTPKVDINALLRPDSSIPNEPVKETTKASSIFNLFTKSENKAEEKKEEKNDNIESYTSSVDSKIAQDEPIYTFKPLPVEVMQDDTSDYKPIKLDEQFNLGNNFEIPKIEENSDIEDEFKPIKIESLSDIDNTYNPINIDENNKETKIEVIEPQMPTIDLSSFQPTNSLPSEPEILMDIPVINTEPKSMVETVKPIVSEQNVVIKPVESIVSETQTISEQVKPTPIIITDYDKQYEPIRPEQKEVEQNKIDFKEIITSIRETSNMIEKAGYEVDTDEIDLGTEYRVIITIKKEN